MKISDFKKDRELVFYIDEEENEQSKMVEPGGENGKIKFYSLDKKLLNKVASAIQGELEYNQLIYEVLPIITDITMDISLEDFNTMLDFPPNNIFINLIDQVNKEFINMVKRYNQFKQNISKTNKEITENINKLPNEIKEKVIENSKTDGEKLADLEVAHENEKDTKKKHELLIKIAKLQFKIENKSKKVL